MHHVWMTSFMDDPENTSLPCVVLYFPEIIFLQSQKTYITSNQTSTYATHTYDFDRIIFFINIFFYVLRRDLQITCWQCIDYFIMDNNKRENSRITSACQFEEFRKITKKMGLNAEWNFFCFDSIILMGICMKQNKTFFFVCVGGGYSN